jgi:Uma2 family endonuclease
MTPSPSPQHQKVAVRLAALIDSFLENHPVGNVFVELDVDLGTGALGENLVYRPDIVFFRTKRLAPDCARAMALPDLVVEIISDSSRQRDLEGKREDYERCGILEYWLIDPQEETMTFFRLIEGRYVAVPPQGNKFFSEAIPGFVLDLARLRRAFRLE